MSKVTFDPVGPMPRLSDTIAERLLEAIVNGRFNEGDALPSERELAAQFGVSRTVIREAIRSLAARGVVEVKSGRGVRVATLDTAPVSEAMALLLRGSNRIDLAQIHEVRTMLEIHTAGLAAERSVAEDHEALERLISAQAGAGDDVNAAADLDVEFHRLIARSTRNELYVVLLDSIAGALLENRRATLAIEHSPARITDEHRSILDAVRSHDAGQARGAMERHLAGAAAAWRGLLDAAMGPR
jgi:GntR family transcriptional repressor for pyruvate dehydrogenase complex